MATKTLTITEDAYNLLKRKKEGTESFSEVITRICKRRNVTLLDCFGIISDEEGEKMIKDLRRIKKKNRELLKGRLS